MKTQISIQSLISVLCLVLCLGLRPACPLAHADPEAFEISKSMRQELPGGKEADGIVGDFILRNDLVEAVISGDAPYRKADMGGWWDAVSPGCLYDLTLRDADNDQITVFSPSNQRGPVTYVRIADEGDSGQAVIEVLVSAASNEGLSLRHEYRLQEGWNGLMVVTHIHNQSDAAIEWDPADQWKPANDQKTIAGITLWDAVDPADKCGYAVTWLDMDGMLVPGDEPLTLAPDQRISLARGIAVGRSPGQAFGYLASLQTASGRFSGTIVDRDGKPVSTATVEIQRDEHRVKVYPDAEGKYQVSLPVGDYTLAVSDMGRSTITQPCRIMADVETAQHTEMNRIASVVFDVRDGEDSSIPCKVQFKGIEGTETPDLGPANRAYGCKDQYHSEKGQFQVALTPGHYQVTVTHGVEFSHQIQTIEVKPESSTEVRVTLKRLVDTTGWVSTDFHNHSTPSGDNTTKTDDRIINLAAEQVEFAPTTEHNRLYDWTPHIEKLGLTKEILSVPGVELTGSGAHFNAFPFQPDPLAQDYGAPRWQKDPRLNAIVLRDFQGSMPERWVHLNHPDMVADFVDRDGDGRPDYGYANLENLVDAAETWGLRILGDAPYYIAEAANKAPIVRSQREFVWKQLLNTGRRMWTLSVSDAHSVHGNGVGGWRTYVPSSTDEPSKIDWKEIVRHAKAGRMMVTTGPFLEVRTEDGQISGGQTRAQGSVRLHVKVQCTDWIRIDRIQVLVNSRKDPDFNFTRTSHQDWFQDGVVQFEQALDIPLSEDSHLIVVAYGEHSNLSIGYGTSTQSAWRPCAYHNPIYIDVDGNGFKPNGDMLGWKLPVKRLDVDAVRALLEKRAP